MEIIEDAMKANELSIDDLRDISNCIDECYKDLKRQAGAKVAATLRKGSKVRISFTANLRPRYLLGTHATVIKVNKATANIRLGEVIGGTGRFYTGQEIRCPLDSLELVEVADAG
jgi:hypothetical protein